MMGDPAVLRLSNELWNAILKEIEPVSNKTIAVDDRRFLSVESFDTPSTEIPNSVADIGKFRRLCKRFADLGAPFLFTRVASRFSEKGLSRLEQLARWDHLACYVKKFSYLVPYFFEQHADDVERIAAAILDTDDISLSRANVRSLQQKARDQRHICTTQIDLRVLKKAISSFTALQSVQLLRVTDDEDRTILSYLQRHEGARRFVNLDWALACSHASRTIGSALLTSSNADWSRFSSPMLSPASAQFLRVTRPESMSILAERLTCLTLHFDDGDNLDAKMRDLSECFKAVFNRAKNMQVVHVGFPIHRPLTLGLEDIFHNVTWEKLHAFGIQAWELSAAEIIALVRRHKNIKGLRLRDVLLKQDSRWKEVLPVLRQDMPRLEWISLRRIGYAPVQQGLPQGVGAEIPDGPFNGGLDSDSEDEDAHESVAAVRELPADGSDEDSDEATSVISREDITMDFPELDPDPDTPVSAPWCDCNGESRLDSAEDLGDDGSRPDNTKRKKWEKWVLRRCPEHGS